MVRRSFRSMERAGKEQELSMGEIIDRMVKDIYRKIQDKDIKVCVRYAVKKTGSVKAWQWKWESIPD